MLPCPKVFFACKVATRAAGTGPRMTSAVLVGDDGLVAPEREPLKDALGTPVRPCPLCTKGETALPFFLLLGCPCSVSSLTPEAEPRLGISAAPEGS